MRPANWPHSSTDSPDSYRGKFPLCSTFHQFSWMFYVYVIESELDRSFYIGKTSDIENRLEFHNSVELNKGITKRKIPWVYYFILEVPDARIAGAIENHIKRMKSRRYIENLSKYPEIGKKLLEKYS